MNVRGLAVSAVMLVFVTSPLVAQEHEEHEPLERHQIGLFTGYTWVPKGNPHE
jgi:hypothetical protein